MTAFTNLMRSYGADPLELSDDLYSLLLKLRHTENIQLSSEEEKVLELLLFGIDNDLLKINVEVI